MPRSAALATSRRPGDGFAADVAHSLAQTPRQLPSRYFYDELGSALFEAICQLPWYRITRDEQRLLETRAREILAQAGPLGTLIELGPGSGEKLATLLSSHVQRAVTVHLVDVSAAALDLARRTLARHPALDVVTHEAEYEHGLDALARRECTSGRTLALFLGSNIGNFHPEDAESMLGLIRAALGEGDGILLGTDLVKPERELVLAYDDPLGVTAAFNRNLLVRMNRELGADFDIGQFSHRALWNPEASRVEMHLVSERRQRVRIPAARVALTLEPGETIWTESSYKYDTAGVRALLARAGFRVRGQWQEGTFALTLGQAE